MQRFIKKMLLLFLCFMLCVCTALFVACDEDLINNLPPNDGEQQEQVDKPSSDETEDSITSGGSQDGSTTDNDKGSETETVVLSGTQIKSEYLTVDDGKLVAVVSNGNAFFEFKNDITTADGATFKVYTDNNCTDEILSQIVELEYGDNTFYIKVTNGDLSATYTAVIRRRPKYIVTFNANGGSAVESQTVEEGFCAIIPSQISTRTGYRFDKWDYDFSSPITQNMTINAEWIAVAYNISYNLCGGTNASQNPATYTIEQNITLNNPTRLGYTFTGWSDDGTITKGSIGDKTFTANWSADVTLSSDGKTVTGLNNNVTELTILSEYNGMSVTAIGEKAFNNTALTSVYISYGIESIGKGAFFKCTALTFVSIPNSVAIVAESVFDDCTALTASYKEYGNALYLGNVDNEFLCLIKMQSEDETTCIVHDDCKIVVGNAFYNCLEMKSVSVSSNNNYYSSADGILYNKNQTAFVYVPRAISGTVTVPDGIESIPSNKFVYRADLASVVLGNSVNSIEQGAFQDCVSLVSITIGSNVSIADNAFINCYKLVEVINNSGINIEKGSDTHGNIAKYALDVKTGVDSAIENKDGYLFYPYGDKNYLVGYVGEETDLTLPTDYDNYDIYNYAFYKHKNLTSVTFGGCVKNIGENAFLGCYGLTKMTLPYVGENASITYNNSQKLKSSFAYLFGGKDNIPSDLMSVTVTGVAGYYSLPQWAFADCVNLKSVTIGQNVTKIGESTFRGCSGLTEITLPFIGEASGASGYIGVFGYIFGYTTTKVDGVTWQYNDSKNGSTGNFYYYYIPSSLKSVTIESKDYTIPYSAFFMCKNITNVVLKRVTAIGESAFNNSGITSVVIPDTVKSIGEKAFYSCKKLTNVTIGNNVTSIGKDAFYSCPELKDIVIPASVTSIGETAFNGLSTIKYSGTLQQWLNITFEYKGVLNEISEFYVNGALVTNLNITEANKVPAYAFYGYKGLKTLIIGDTVESIGAQAFYECELLSKVTVGCNVNNINFNAFGACYKLVEVINKSSLPITKGSDEDGYIGYYALSVINDGDESKIKNENGYLFCTSEGVNYLIGYVGDATVLTLPESYNGESYQIYQYAFYNCESIVGVTIGNKVTSIGEKAFYGCNSLLSVTIDFVFEDINEYIGEYAFLDCYKLVEVIFNSDLSESDMFDAYNFFYYSLNIKQGGESEIKNEKGYLFYTGGYEKYLIGYVGDATELILPDSYNRDSYQIYQYAFYNCKSIVSVTIGENVTRIGEKAFYGCDSLKSVTFSNQSGWSAGSNTLTLTDASQNAEYLSSTYANKSWSRAN